MSNMITQNRIIQLEKFKISQLKIELKLEKKKNKRLKKDLQNKIDIILRLNNIIHNLPVAAPIN